MSKRFLLLCFLIFAIALLGAYYFEDHKVLNLRNNDFHPHIQDSILLSANTSGSGFSNWSDSMTWQNGQIPPNGENVTILAGKTVILDTYTNSLGSLIIYGKLVASPLVNVGIIASNIMVMPGGTLEIGNETSSYTRKANLTLTGPRSVHTLNSEDNSLKNDGISRSIMVMPGGTLKLFGAHPQLLKTKLNAHAPAGTTTFTLSDNVQWKAGDKIAISLTDFYGVGQTEILTLAADSVGNIITTTTPLQTSRWGLLQYPTDNGLSLTPGVYTPTDPASPRVLDQRAEVVLLTRNIVVQSANDTDWNSQGFGVHTMIEGLNSVAKADGIEIVRGGQRRALARYPWHWHMLSYTPYNATQTGGQYLGDAIPGTQFLRDSSIWNSENRAVTIHGSNGVTVDNVYAVDIKGHAFFQEDGSEMGNTISNSIAMKTRDPGAANRIKIHDQFASGFWLANPNNTVVNNSGSDSDGKGLWNSFSSTKFGLSRNVGGFKPLYIPIKQFDNNIGHSNRQEGISTAGVVVDEAGNFVGVPAENRYLTGSPISSEFFMRNNVVWKNKGGGYSNRVHSARYLNWTAADNDGVWHDGPLLEGARDFQGVTIEATMAGTLLVGTSLNNATPRINPTRIALSSYHHDLAFINITAINYPFSPPVIAGNFQFVYGGGVFDGSDMYVHPVSLGHIYDVGWKLINSHPGYLTPSPYFDGFPLNTTLTQGGGFRYWAISGARWDPHGYWGPAGNYILPSNNTFYTYNLSSFIQIAPSGQNGVSTPDRFFGMHQFQLNNPGAAGWEGMLPVAPIRMARLNGNNVEVGNHTISGYNSVWTGGFRHFALANGGRYALTYPSGEMPSTAFQVYIENAYRVNDSFLIALPWNGTIPVKGSLGTTQVPSNIRVFNNSGNNINDVINDVSGRTIWQDYPNNRVWIKYMGGLPWNTNDPYTDHLKRPYVIRLLNDSGSVPPISGIECSDGLDNDGDGLVDWQYDLGCNNQTDVSELSQSRALENGWTTFDLANDAEVVFVANNGDNSNCQTYSKTELQNLAPSYSSLVPCATLARGKQLIDGLPNGRPHWLLIRRGDTFSESINGWSKSGRSQSEPVLIGTYGSSTTRPILQGGRFSTGGILNYVALTGLQFVNSGVFHAINADHQFNYFLIENNHIENVVGGSGINLQMAPITRNNLQIRRNILHDIDNNGIYIQILEDSLIEENLIYNIRQGIFHAMYIQPGFTRNITVRGNIVSVGKDLGNAIMHRADAIVEDNFITNYGWSAIVLKVCDNASEDCTQTTGGVIPRVVRANNNVITGARSNSPIGTGIQIGDLNNLVSPGSEAKNNIIVNSPSSVSGSPISLSQNIDSFTLENNIIYNWGSGRLTVAGTGSNSPQNFVLRNNQIKNSLVANSLINIADLSSMGGIIAQNNKWYSSLQSQNSWFSVPSLISFAQWQSQTGETGTNTDFSYVDSSRSLATYSASLGLASTNDAFLTRAMQQDRLNWDNRLRAYSINDYIRQGFTLISSQSAPTAPSGLNVGNPTSSSLNLTWIDNSNNENNFTIQRNISGTFTDIATVSANTVSYVNTGLSSGTSYQYRVRANNNVGSSAYSNIASGTTLQTIPNTPSGLSVSVINNTALGVNWIDNSNNENNFILSRRSIVGGNPNSWVNLSVSANSVNFVNSGLTPGTLYEFRILANNSAGQSSWSNIASNTTLQNPAHIYTLSRSPVSGSVQQSSSVQTIVTATYVSGTSSLVNFTVTNLSTGVTASFSQNSCTPTAGVPCSVTLTLSASAGATIVNNRQVVITSSSWLSNVNTTYLMNVTAPPICTNGATQGCSLTLGVCAGSTQTCVGNNWPGCTAANYGPNYAVIETGVAMCNDGLDNDCDGSRDLGGDSGCPLPGYGSFSQSLTTNFSQVTDFTNVSSLSLGIVNLGRIQFLQNVSLWRLNAGVYSAINLDSAVQISYNSIRINSESYPEFNKSARITFYNLTYSEIPAVMIETASGLVVCPATRCAIQSYNASSGELVVLVSGFSNYTTQAAACGDAFCSSSESCSICSSDCGECSTTSGSSGSGGSGGSGGGSSGGSSGGTGITSTVQCNDNIDNDGDNLIDFPQDPGCLSSQDNIELDGTVLGGEEFEEPTETLTPETKDIQIGFVFWFVLAILALGIVIVGIIIASYMHKRKKFQEYVKRLNK